MARAETLYTCPQLEIAASRNLIVLAWYEHPTVAIMREIARAGRAVARQYPGGSAMINIFLSGTPKFSDEVREEVVRVNRDASLYPLGAARLILLPGLQGVAVRAFLNTVTLLSRQAARPTQAFGDLHEAAVWLTPRLERSGERWTVGEVVAVATPYLTPREQRGAA